MANLLAYLNNNSGAIQALASILILCVTIALAIITWRYVALTRTLALTAKDELRMKREEKAAQDRRLVILLKMFKERIDSLPYEQAKGEHIRKAISWEQAEIDNLTSLAADIGHQSVRTASILCERLKWIKEQIDLVKSTDQRIGFEWNEFPWDRWLEELTKSKANIGEMTIDILNDKLGFQS
jgi:hypothetical protein